MNELTTQLHIKEKEVAKLKEDNRLLLKHRSASKESKQLEVKVDKVPLLYEDSYFTFSVSGSLSNSV